MKYFYIKTLCFIAIVGIFSSSCKKGNFLDPVNLGLDTKAVFTDSVRTMQYLASIYNVLDVNIPNGRYDANSFGVPTGQLSDESVSKWSDGIFPGYVSSNTYNSAFRTQTTNNWTTHYGKIRAVNILLKEIEAGPLNIATKNRIKFEARFLRAFYYATLLKFYGGVPLVGDEVKPADTPFDILRGTYADGVNYVVSELDAIAPGLPLEYTGIDYGRITRGAALALKAKILLYAASPFFNGGGETTNPNQIGIIGYPNNDPARWQKAMDAAKAVISLNKYSLVTGPKGIGFYQLFLQRVNTEYILPLMQAPNTFIEQFGLPPSRNSGIGGTFGMLEMPTQNLVDRFTTIDGKPAVAGNPLYNPNEPYRRRDPRFYHSIIFNGAKYTNRTAGYSEVFTYFGAAEDGFVPELGTNGTKTGYFNRKMCDSTVTANGVGSNTNRVFPIIRFADIKLMYAEAANETGQPDIALQELKDIRDRAGILPGNDGNYGLPVSPTKDELRIIIQDERMVELAFENQRFWDIKRWNLGKVLINGPLTSMRVNKVGTSYTYERRSLATVRRFTVQSQLWPIPQRELDNNFNFQQNPGW
ncbi:RagB/SusD family nutrient uptake outer membrane protein [Pedobacter frigoris]|uniref:RagB/SusD family nutrient uptake outer membrane protein n=1 Tax=Pedobacter frigoris TaxID=2571272 RepID=UPI00293164F3|nr:RagB/SusD family nutrient uptake outer membrane protein [Pedobacter frigoris]